MTTQRDYSAPHPTHPTPQSSGTKSRSLVLPVATLAVQSGPWDKAAVMYIQGFIQDLSLGDSKNAAFVQSVQLQYMQYFPLKMNVTLRQ